MDDAEPARVCEDCAPPLRIQGGAWGWQGHRFWLHGEGSEPAGNPYTEYPIPADRAPRTEREKAESRRRRAAASIRRQGGNPQRRGVR